MRVRLLFFSFLFLTSIVQAGPITFSFIGTVTDDPFDLVPDNAPISGSYTFDSAALDSIAGSANGAFASSGPGFGFTVGCRV